MSLDTWRPSFVQRSPELDGLRGVAILLVFFAHVFEGVAPHDRPLIPGMFNPVSGGGYLGVQLFFVLSGFLITTILLAERHKTGRISLRNFYLRRIRRLVPALAIACIAYAIYALVVLRGRDLVQAFGSIGRAATYTQNLDPVLRWWPDSGWLQHTWSLSVEEQFYLSWPLLLILVAPRGRRALLAVAIGGALLTLALRFGVDATVKPSKAYAINYLMLRWDALLVGCVLAVAAPRIPRPVIWLGVAVFGFYTVRTYNQPHVLEYTVTALASGCVLVAALRSRWLANPILTFFGQISYGLYIWHLLLMRLDVPTWASAGASVVVAWLSYRFIELRFLHARPAVVPPESP